MKYNSGQLIGLIIYSLIFSCYWLGTTVYARSGRNITLEGQYSLSRAIGKIQPGYHAQVRNTKIMLSNRNQDFTVEFYDDDGLFIQHQNHYIRMRLAAVGAGRYIENLDRTQAKVSANQISYDHGRLQQWFVNGPMGLQQGFTLEKRPSNATTGNLVVSLNVEGDLSPRLAADGRGVDFIAPDKSVALQYTGLMVVDAHDRQLPARMEVNRKRIDIVVNDGNAVYPVIVDPIFQQAKLTANDGSAGDNFGSLVAVDGNIIVVGAPHDNDNGIDSGSAYVFSRNRDGADNWGQITKLTAYDSAANDLFGVTVAVSGDTIVIGASHDDDKGSVYVFSRNLGGTDNWGLQAKLIPTDGPANELFGSSVSISGDVIVVGARYDDDNGTASGSAYIFSRNQGGWYNWGQVAKLTATDGAPNDYFGTSVSISNNTIVVGAPHDNDNGIDSGSAYIFNRNQGGVNNWGQVIKITALDGAAKDHFGGSVSIRCDSIVIGATGDDNNGESSGAAYVFNRNKGGADNWGQRIKLMPADGASYSYFGDSVSISGNTIVVGSTDDDSRGSNSGSAYVFSRNHGGADNWGQEMKLTAADGANYDWFGRSVASSGKTIVIGSPGNDVNGQDAGAVYIFKRSGNNWTQKNKTTADDGAAHDNFGRSVAVSCDTLVIGAPYDDDNGTDSGSAYVFSRNHGGADNWGQLIKLSSSDGAAGDNFGWAVSISGDTLVVGTPNDDDNGSNSGSAYVFSRNYGGADNWGQVAKLTTSFYGNANDQFGFSVAISGDRIVVGAPYNDVNGTNSGAAYIFERTKGGVDNWGNVGRTRPVDNASGDHFGTAIAISGNTIVVGAPYDDDSGTNSGSVYIIERSPHWSDWRQSTKLTANDGTMWDTFGSAVAISGNTIVVGSPNDKGNGTNYGSAYIFTRHQGGPDNWGQVTKLKANDGVADDHQFGRSVTIDGNTVLVGAFRDNINGTDSGSAYVFRCNLGGANNWGQKNKLTADDGATNDYFGRSVAISNDTIVVGADGDNDPDYDVGSVYLFKNEPAISARPKFNILYMVVPILFGRK